MQYCFSTVCHSNMERNVWLISFIIGQISINQIFAAPNCDLRSVFRTPRDFDQFELIERSSFDPTRDKANADHLKADTKPYANAQVLLRINCDNENAKDTAEPCIPISKLTNTVQKVVERDLAVPQYHPIAFQQYSNPYHMHAPYVFPNCLYYNALGALCSHFLPVFKEVLRAKAAPKEREAECPKSSEDEDAITAFDNIPLKVVLEENRECDDKTIKDDERVNIRPEINNLSEPAGIEGIGENCEVKKAKNSKSKDKHEKRGKKKVKKDKNKPKDKENCKDRESNIQKIPEDGKVDLKSIIEGNTNAKVISLNAINLSEPSMCAEKVERDAEVQKESLDEAGDEEEPKSDSENYDRSLHLLKVPQSNDTDNVECTANATNIAQILNEALIPITCLGSQENIKNVITYPIFNQNLLENENKPDISVENSGCLKSFEDEASLRAQHATFAFDIDDLNLMHGTPVTQSSIIRNLAPKYLKDIITEKTLAQHLPVLREDPKLTIVTYEEAPRLCPVCSRKECICNLNDRNVYQEQPQIVYVEPKYEKQVVGVIQRAVKAPLPSYLSRQLSKPLPIYEQAVQESPEEILVPVTIVANEETTSGRCPTCSPYIGELNQS